MDYSNHMPGFTKLFSGLVHSTVWREEMHVKVVWITMLALADRNGNVLASLPGLADASRVSLEQCQDALSKLSSPDVHSRTKLHEGRRIEEVDGGWRLLNYLKYRNMRDEENRRQQVREAVGRYRAKQSDVIDVSHGKPRKAQAEAEAYTEATAARPQPLRPPAVERPANPLVAGRRVDLEREFLSLVSEIAKLTDRDPLEVAREATGYEGARTTPINPASMSDDRLANSVMDLRSNAQSARAKAERRARGVREVER